MAKAGLDVKCRRVLIVATESDIERWDRRKEDFRRRGVRAYASRSGAIRADARAASYFHHNTRGMLNTIALTAHELRTGTVAPSEAADVLERTVKAMLGLILEA